MQTSGRAGMGRVVAAVAVVVVIVIAGGLGFVLTSNGTKSTTSSSTTSSTTTSSVTTSSTSSNTTTTSSSTTTSSTSTGCTFSQAEPEIAANSTANYFTGCLTPGSTGVYLLGIADPHGMVAQGVIRSQYNMSVTFAGTPVGNLSAAAKGAKGLTANETTVVPMSDVSLLGSSGYSITVVNQSDQNNTVIINLTLTDFDVFVG
jgi:hypothetical protein